jgi:hypothetical protein
LSCCSRPVLSCSVPPPLNACFLTPIRPSSLHTCPDLLQCQRLQIYTLYIVLSSVVPSRSNSNSNLFVLFAVPSLLRRVPVPVPDVRYSDSDF